VNLVRPTQWFEPTRLVLVYDVQSDVLDTLYAHSLTPGIADISDESVEAWVWTELSPTHIAFLGAPGPHAGRFAALFADAHAATASGDDEVLLWSGARWWK
jgi:prepilin-type processing-associated H-X9-DG protein